MSKEFLNSRDILNAASSPHFDVMPKQSENLAETEIEQWKALWIPRVE